MTSRDWSTFLFPTGWVSAEDALDARDKGRQVLLRLVGAREPGIDLLAAKEASHRSPEGFSEIRVDDTAYLLVASEVEDEDSILARTIFVVPNQSVGESLILGSVSLADGIRLTTNGSVHAPTAGIVRHLSVLAPFRGTGLAGVVIDSRQFPIIIAGIEPQSIDIPAIVDQGQIITYAGYNQNLELRIYGMLDIDLRPALVLVVR